MSSPAPISFWKDICGNCWKKLDTDKMIFIRFKKYINWACCKKCLMDLAESYLEQEESE